MQPTRDTHQNKRPTQTESEGLEKIFKANGQEKESCSNNTYIRPNRLQNKSIKTDSEGHFIILKGRIHQQDINIINIYAPNIGTP